MKKEYIDFYLAITDVKRLKPDVWHRCPSAVEKKEFLQWYERTTMAISFSQGDTHFIIHVYPTEAEKKRVLSSVGYVEFKKELIKVNPINVSTYPVSPVYVDIIPGVCSRPDIVDRILGKVVDKNSQLSKQHLAKLEQRKRFKDFCKIDEAEDDGL